jgi:hypothetical protein
MDDKRKEIIKELEEISPELLKFKEEKGFAVPHNYFKNLPGNVLNRLDQETNRGPLNHSSWIEILIGRLYQPKTGLAFAALTMILLTVFFLLQKPKEQDLFAEITIDEAYQYVANHMEEFDETLFYSLDLPQDFSVDGFNYDDAEVDEWIDDLIEDLIEDQKDLEDLL